MLIRRLFLLGGVVVLLLSSIFTGTQQRSPSVLSGFRLPALPGTQLLVRQGNDGAFSHFGTAEFAFDFVLPEGGAFTITAAQGGTVIGFNDVSSTVCDKINHEQNTPPDKIFPCWTYGNFLLIANDDRQTASLYEHLAQGSVKVHLHDHVTQGTPLAITGTTGFSTEVHLHFQVENCSLLANWKVDCNNPPDPQLDPHTGWWFQQSIAIAFDNPEVRQQNADGVPKEGQSFVVSTPPTSIPSQQTTVPPPPPTTVSSSPSSAVLPGGMWTDPSPTDGQVVTDVIHFAAHAYPTHSGDPAIAHINFTVGSQGSWKVACTASPPATGDIFSCDANLKDLGVPYGQIQASFDVYDQGGNVNYAPNGVHTLTYAPSPGATPVPPTPVPTPTPSPTPVATPTPTDTPTPVPVTLSSGTWNDPYGGASYGTGEPVTIVLTVNGSNVSGTMKGDFSGGTTPITGQTGSLSSFSQQDQGFLDYVVQNYGSGTGVFLVYQNTQDFIGAFAGSTYYMVLQSNGTLQGFWYFLNQQIDTGALTFNRIS
jgi:hypothetical protein